jgi:hypothetical protein
MGNRANGALGHGRGKGGDAVVTGVGAAGPGLSRIREYAPALGLAVFAALRRRRFRGAMVKRT